MIFWQRICILCGSDVPDRCNKFNILADTNLMYGIGASLGKDLAVSLTV